MTLKSCGPIAFLLFLAPAHASVIHMRCNNGVHNFIATFDEVKRRFSENDSVYHVLSVERNGSSYMVVGTASNDGPPPTPTFRAFLSPMRKIEYFMDGKLFQTDKCR